MMAKTDEHHRTDLSIDQQLALRTAAARLRESFDGVFGAETIERFLHSGYDQFAAHSTDWVVARWEDSNPEPGKPRRRLCKLTPVGRVQALALLEERTAGAGRKAVRRVPRPNLTEMGGDRLARMQAVGPSNGG